MAPPPPSIPLRTELTRTCLVCSPAALFDGLYWPAYWPTFSNDQIYPALVAILLAGRAYNFTDPYILPENPVGSLPDTPTVPTTSSADAIAGADGAVSDGVSVKMVFQDLVRTTRELTPTCSSSRSSSVLMIFGLTKVSSRCSVVPLVGGPLSLTQCIH